MPITVASKNTFTNERNTISKRDQQHEFYNQNHLNDSSSTLHSLPSSTIYDGQNCNSNQNILVIPTNGYNQQNTSINNQQQHSNSDNHQFLTIASNKNNHFNNSNCNNQKFANNNSQQQQQQQQLQQRRYLQRENSTEFPVSNKTDELLRLTHLLPTMNTNITYSSVKVGDSKNVLNSTTSPCKIDADRLSSSHRSTPQISPRDKYFNESANNNSLKILSNGSQNNNNSINLQNGTNGTSNPNDNNLKTTNPTFNNSFNSGSVVVRIPAEILQQSNLCIAVSYNIVTLISILNNVSAQFSHIIAKIFMTKILCLKA